MGQPKISADDVRQVVPAGPEAQADFGIANAIGRNDAADALHELGLSLDAGAQPVMVLGQLRFAAEKLPSARLRKAVEAVFRTDLALKSSGGEPRVLLERLVVELCEDRRPTRRA
jgi:DNA polymerase III delta subunit